MKRHLPKYISLLLALLLLLPAFGAILPVSAVEYVKGSNSASDSYKSSIYYSRLFDVKLTGDGRTDVVAIALSQLGYTEGDKSGEFSGLSGGTRNFTEYNYNFGKYNDTDGYGYYWCASFVNWCLRQAGIPEKATAGAEVSCQRWISDCRADGIFVSKGGYIPNEGDIIFFKDQGSSVDSTHVGLVRYSDGHNVYTVEGNTSNGSEYSSNGEYVALKSYPLSSSYIVGYAAPRYEENKTAKRVDRSGGFLSAGQYISLGDLALSSDAECTSPLNATVPDHTVFTVTEVFGDTLKVSFDGKTGYAKTSDSTVQISSSQNVYVINYVNDDGRPIFKPQYCTEGQEKSIYSNTPKREKSGFVGWKSTGSDALLSPGSALGAISKDINLVAVWDSNYYIVTFKAHDGTIIDQVHGYYGTEYDIPEPPEAPEGMVFFTWGEGADGIIRGNSSYTACYISEDELQSASADTEIIVESTTEDGAGDKGCRAGISVSAAVISSLIGAFGMLLNRKKK